MGQTVQAAGAESPSIGRGRPQGRRTSRGANDGRRGASRPAPATATQAAEGAEREAQPRGGRAREHRRERDHRGASCSQLVAEAEHRDRHVARPRGDRIAEPPIRRRRARGSRPRDRPARDPARRPSARSPTGRRDPRPPALEPEPAVAERDELAGRRAIAAAPSAADERRGGPGRRAATRSRSRPGRGRRGRGSGRCACTAQPAVTRRARGAREERARAAEKSGAASDLEHARR